MHIYEIVRDKTLISTIRECDFILAQHGIIINEAAPSFVGGVRAGAAAPGLKGYTAAGQTAAEKAGIAVGQTGGKIGDVAGRASSKLGSAVKNKVAREMSILDLKGKPVESFVPKTAIRFAVAVKWIGMWPFFTEYWEEKTAINSLEQKKELSAADASAARRILIEELIAKILVSSSFAGLLRWILRLRYIRTIAKIAAVGASGMTLGLLGGPAVISVLATEAAAIWLEKFLQSDQGKTIIANTVMYAIDPTVTWLWNAGPGAWVDALKAPELSAAGQEKVEKVVGTTGDSSEKVAAAGAAGTAAAGKTGQGAQPDTSAATTPSGPAFDAVGNPYAKWGVSDPYANLPKLPDTKLFK